MTTRKVEEKPSTSEAVRQAWEYPLFNALAERRSRRFGLGMEIKGGPNKYKSESAPVPLSEMETALIAWAACGINGYNLSDLPYHQDGVPTGGATIIKFQGRTIPSPCASHGTELFFTNDDGVFMFKMRDAIPDAVRQFRTVEDRDKILELFRKHTIKLSDRRLEIPWSTPGPTAGRRGEIEGINDWDVNKPGTTVWMPVTDMAFEYINILTQIGKGGMVLIDDFNGNVPAGLESWVTSGYLDPMKAYTLSMRERFCFQMEIMEGAFMMQNIQLAQTAMGIGGWTFANPMSLVVMGGTPLAKGLGFRFVMPKRSHAPGSKPEPNPVGIDGVFEAYCPTYYGSMDNVVDAIYAAKYGENGIYSPAYPYHPYKDRDAFNAEVPKPTSENAKIAKDICGYLYDTYGRVPATVDTMYMHFWTQSHHVEMEYYDKYYPEGTYSDAHANHMKLWHPDL